MSCNIEARLPLVILSELGIFNLVIITIVIVIIVVCHHQQQEKGNSRA